MISGTRAVAYTPMSHATRPLPRAAYVHIPFCRHRCGYCNFTLVAGRDDLIDSYLAAIERELSFLGQPREVDTLFLGGGTPTHLPPAKLHRLLELVREWFPLAGGYEFSIEATPIDLNTDVSRILVQHGVTRISLGVQSFDGDKLKMLERDHRADDICRAYDHARAVASSVSLDLIFAVPGESLAGWQRDLNAALALHPDHLSTSGLTFEKGTSYFSRLLRGDLQQQEEESERRMYEAAITTLTRHGFEHYEISNFARPGHRCRHNEVYWRGQPYYAAGPGAARYVSGIRETNHRSVATYLKRVHAGESPVAETEQLGTEEAARERLVFQLRMLEGVDVERFESETGCSLETLAGVPLRRYTEMGLLERSATHLKLSRKGLFVSDSLWPAILQP